MEFERNIPVPPSTRGRDAQAPRWAGMQVGDSVLFEGKKFKHIKGKISYLKKRYGFECVARHVEGGTRLWRTG